MSLFKRKISREINWFYKILNLFRILDIESEVIDDGLVAVMLTYDRNGRGCIGYVTQTCGDVLPYDKIKQINNSVYRKKTTVYKIFIA